MPKESNVKFGIVEIADAKDANNASAMTVIVTDTFDSPIRVWSKELTQIDFRKVQSEGPFVIENFNDHDRLVFDEPDVAYRLHHIIFTVSLYECFDDMIYFFNKDLEKLFTPFSEKITFKMEGEPVDEDMIVHKDCIITAVIKRGTREYPLIKWYVTVDNSMHSFMLGGFLGMTLGAVGAMLYNICSR